MKKLIFSLSALAALLLAGSCQRENLESVQQGGTVTYTVQVPEAIATKAESGDGYTLYYQVYRENDLANDDARPVYKGSKDFLNGRVELPLEFVKGQNFHVLFWAQQKTGAQAYKIDDLRKVSLQTLVANDATADVFAGNDYVKDCKSDKEGGNVKLERPVAQLNIATLTSGLKLGSSDSYIVVPETSDLKVTGDNVLCSTYNVATGECSDKVVKLNYSNGVTKNDGNFSEEYTLIGMSYIGFFNGGINVDVEFNIYTKDDGTINHVVSNVPIKPNYKTNIIGNLISATADYNVTLEDWEDAEITYATDAEDAQAALDNATAGDIIKLHPGVNYGTLYMRPVEGGAQTKVVDWIGNNYHFETYSLFENITIVGAEGATVDAIEIEGGTYYNTPHSQSSEYPVMLSLIELKNVVIDGVTFTGKGGYDPQGHGNAINLSGNNIKVDGLTIKNCTLNNPENNARLIYKTESTTTEHKYTYDDQTKALPEYTFTPSLKNITVTGTTFNGGYMGLELRETDNVTITNNEFNVADRNILLAVNTGCTYSGKITITGNVSNNAEERFVRADGTGDAEVVISNNTIINYDGEDPDYIKVTNGNNVTIENNEKVRCVKTWGEFTEALAAGEDNIKLTEDITYDKSYDLKQDVTIDLNKKSFEISTLKKMLNIGDAKNSTKPNVTIKNGKINCMVYALSGNLTITDVEFGGTIEYVSASQGLISTKHANLLMENCKMTNVKKSGGTKPRSLCTEGRSSGYLILRDCNFKNSNLDRPYINPLNGNTTLELTNCALYSMASNIDLGASYSWTNMNLTGCSGGFTFTISRASTSLTDEEMAVYKAIKKNNSGSMRFIFTDGEKNSL